MYNKLTGTHKTKHIYGFEDEPPEKKLISDGDILIKELAKKQRNTQVTLEGQLKTRSNFYKSTEEVSITSYTSGPSTLQEFHSILHHSDNVEKLKASGLSDEEIELFLDFKSGNKYVKEKHKNLNESVLKDYMEEIFKKLKPPASEGKIETTKSNRLKNELTLATKPTSIETKLLKFALENQQTSKKRLPSAIDQIKNVEQELMNSLSNPDIKKIRKKARRLAKQIDALNAPKEAIVKQSNSCPYNENMSLASTSKWDVQKIIESDPKEAKVYTCKPQNLYTIRDGQIVKVNSEVSMDKQHGHLKGKLTLEEIRKMPKFGNYERGSPSKVLYLKNLANGVVENDIKDVLGEFLQSTVSVNVLKGRMRGQAFIEFEDEQVAEKVLDQCNGIFLKNKPIIIQFGKGKYS